MNRVNLLLAIWAVSSASQASATTDMRFKPTVPEARIPTGLMERLLPRCFRSTPTRITRVAASPAAKVAQDEPKLFPGPDGRAPIELR